MSTILTDPAMTIDEAAEKLRLSPDTLRAWRKTGKGPVARVVAGKLIYLASDLHKWLTDQPTS